MVDITIEDLRTHQMVGGIAVKFVMQNYSQNSNNYFENMLGETANIRAAHCPYFQMFIILDRLPYYKRSGVLTKWESFTHHNVRKYVELAKDNVEAFYHTPNKTLIYVVHLEPNCEDIATKDEYMDYYKSNISIMKLSESSFDYNELSKGGTVILNDYELFIDKVYHIIKAL